MLHLFQSWALKEKRKQTVSPSEMNTHICWDNFLEKNTSKSSPNLYIQFKKRRLNKVVMKSHWFSVAFSWFAHQVPVPDGTHGSCSLQTRSYLGYLLSKKSSIWNPEISISFTDNFTHCTNHNFWCKLVELNLGKMEEHRMKSLCCWPHKWFNSK